MLSNLAAMLIVHVSVVVLPERPEGDAAGACCLSITSKTFI